MTRVVSVGMRSVEMTLSTGTGPAIYGLASHQTIISDILPIEPNPNLVLEPLRESHLETINDWRPPMEVAMKRSMLGHRRWRRHGPASMMPIGERPHVYGGDKSGSMGRISL